MAWSPPRSTWPPRSRPSATSPRSPTGRPSSARSRPPATTCVRRRRARPHPPATTWPRRFTAEDAERDRHARALLREALVSIGVAVVIMIAMFVPQTTIAMEDINRLALIPATFIQVWAGRRFYRPAWRAARHGTANMDTLVAVGTTAAWAYSVVVTAFPEVIHEAGLHPETYFDSSTIIIGLVLLGPLAGGPSQGRRDRRHPAAHRPPGGDRPSAASTAREEDVALEAVVVGDLLRVRAGETVPVDGVVVEGASAVDTSMLTGEPIPVAVGPEATVIGATRNTTGTFVMRADRRRPGHGPRPHRRPRRPGAGQQGADPAPRRPHRRGVRAGRPAARRGHVRRVVPVRPGATPDAGPDLVHRRRRHRLPVRPRAGHADRDHGRDRARRRGRHPHPRRRGARDRPPRRHRRVRQDRHAHARTTDRRRGRAGPGPNDRGRARPGRQRRDRQRAPARPRPSSPVPDATSSGSPGSSRSRRSSAAASGRRVRARRRRPSGRSSSGRSGCWPMPASTWRRSTRAIEALATHDRTVTLVAIDGRAAGLLAISDPVKAEAVSALRGAGRRRHRDLARERRPTSDGPGRGGPGRHPGPSRPGRGPARRARPGSSAGCRARPDRGHGRRRHQRRAGAGPGRCRASPSGPGPTSPSRPLR